MSFRMSAVNGSMSPVRTPAPIRGVDVAGQHRVHHVVGEVVRLVVVAHPAVRVDDAHGRVLGDGLVGDRRVRSHVGVDL